MTDRCIAPRGSAGTTNDLVWQLRVASAVRNWMENDFIEYSRLLEARKKSLSSPSWGAATGAPPSAAGACQSGVCEPVQPVFAELNTPAVEEITIDTSTKPPTPATEGDLGMRMHREFIWHRDLMSRLARCMRMSRHGAYLEPTVRLPLPQKGA